VPGHARGRPGGKGGRAWGDGGRVQVSVAVAGWYRWKERSRAVILIPFSGVEWQCGNGGGGLKLAHAFFLN
jgi:hypothetical protein